MMYYIRVTRNNQGWRSNMGVQDQLNCIGSGLSITVELPQDSHTMHRQLRLYFHNAEGDVGTGSVRCSRVNISK